jgi:hypothetical protein
MQQLFPGTNLGGMRRITLGDYVDPILARLCNFVNPYSATYKVCDSCSEVTGRPTLTARLNARC